MENFQIIDGQMWVQAKTQIEKQNSEIYDEMLNAGLVEETEKKPMLPKGFLSTNGIPTQNALMMYFVYLVHRKEDWNENKGRCKYGVQKVREYFGVDYGFECMITWGLLHGCQNSKTSDGRYYAMTKAYRKALSLLGNITYTDKKL
jgi:hypothetical protein